MVSLKATGGFIGVGYFLVAADLATSVGILSSIFVPAAHGVSAVGLVVYASADIEQKNLQHIVQLKTV